VIELESVRFDGCGASARDGETLEAILLNAGSGEQE
jgi:hypothetical protein